MAYDMCVVTNVDVGEQLLADLHVAGLKVSCEQLALTKETYIYAYLETYRHPDIQTSRHSRACAGIQAIVLLCNDTWS